MAHGGTRAREGKGGRGGLRGPGWARERIGGERLARPIPPTGAPRAPGVRRTFTMPLHLQSPGATAVGECRAFDGQAREACEARQSHRQPPPGASGGSGSGSVRHISVDGTSRGRGHGYGCGAIGGGSSDTGAAPKGSVKAAEAPVFFCAGLRLVASQWLPGWLSLEACLRSVQEPVHTIVCLSRRQRLA